MPYPIEQPYKTYHITLSRGKKKQSYENENEKGELPAAVCVGGDAMPGDRKEPQVIIAHYHSL